MVPHSFDEQLITNSMLRDKNNNHNKSTTNYNDSEKWKQMFANNKGDDDG